MTCVASPATGVAAPQVVPQAGVTGQNSLLDALPEPDWQRWQPGLEPVLMPQGMVLREQGHATGHVYFPTTAIVSIQVLSESGQSAEIAKVGREGLVGIALFLGGENAIGHSVVQCAGCGYRMNAHTLKAEFEGSGTVKRLMLRYALAVLTQMGQTAVCNRHHTLDQQLCRCLLMSLDRLRGAELLMTQEQMARMLGVRREGVTEAALALLKAGLIHYQRGHITVLDRPGLEQRSCECYGVVKREYDRLLPVGQAR